MASEDVLPRRTDQTCCNAGRVTGAQAGCGRLGSSYEALEEGCSKASDRVSLDETNYQWLLSRSCQA